MKKKLILILVLALILCLAACDSPEENGDGQQGPDTVGLPATPDEITPLPDPDPVPDEPDPEPVEYPWQAIYTGFLSENYEALEQLCYGGIAGLGFIDLDVDGVPELVIFDSGASASMGVQFFDIAGDFVVCVAANSAGLREAYGADDFSEVRVNANYFDDFRLILTEEGKAQFYVESWNGAIDFSYSEVVRFERGQEHMELVSVLYKSEEYDVDTGEATQLVCQAGGEEISQQEYTDTYSYIFNRELTEWKSAGSFIWESKDYDDGFEGFMAMAEHAMGLYVPVADFLAEADAAA